QGAFAGCIAEQGAHGVELGLLEHPALGKGRALAPAGSGMDRPAHDLPAAARDLRYVVHAHQITSPRVSRWHTIYQRFGWCRGAPARAAGGGRRGGWPTGDLSDGGGCLLLQANTPARRMRRAARAALASSSRAPSQACDGLARVEDVALSLTGHLQVWP